LTGSLSSANDPNSGLRPYVIQPADSNGNLIVPTPSPSGATSYVLLSG